MIRYTTGNMFDASYDAIVNTVNTEGIMGKGLALQFKKRFPDNFSAYASACKRKEIVIGSIFVHALNSLGGTRYILNFPTKTLWRNKSRMEAIVAGLRSLKEHIISLGIKSIAIPPLGCGLGGLAWGDVKREIERTLGDLDGVDIVLYEPLRAPNPAPVVVGNKNLTSIKALLLRCYDMYMSLVPSTDLTFVEAQKLAYFLQHACGVSEMKLQFAPWRYGPYADNLRHMLSDMEGRWIQGFHDGTAQAFDTMTLLPAAHVAKNMALPEQYLSALAKLDTAIEGFESPLGLELLATTHWLITHDNVEPKSQSVMDSIRTWAHNEDWGARKSRLFTAAMVDLAIERVTSLSE